PVTETSRDRNCIVQKMSAIKVSFERGEVLNSQSPVRGVISDRGSLQRELIPSRIAFDNRNAIQLLPGRVPKFFHIFIPLPKCRCAQYACAQKGILSDRAEHDAGKRGLQLFP